MRAMFGTLVAVVLAAGVARAGEEKIALDKLPKAVAEAVKKRFPKAELVEAAKETEGAKTEYEVTLKDGKTKLDVMLSPEGKITLIEKTIDAKDLPKAVAAAIEAKYPKGTIKLAEEVTTVTDGKEAVGYYEAVIAAADKKTYEVQVAADGTIKNTEEKKGEEKDEKEEKKDKK